MQLAEFATTRPAHIDPHGDILIHNMIKAVHSANTTQGEMTAAKGVTQLLEATFTQQYQVMITPHGSAVTDTALPGSDLDFVLIFPAEFTCDECIAVINWFADTTGSVIIPPDTPIGNLVTMQINGLKCDLLCVSELLEWGYTDSLNLYLGIEPMWMCSNIPIEIRLTRIYTPFVGDKLHFLHQMSANIKQSEPSYAAFFLMKMLCPKLSSAVITCLVTMSNNGATSIHCVLHHIIYNMKSIIDMTQQPSRVARSTRLTISQLSTYQVENGCIFVLTDYQIKQIAIAYPTFVNFLKSVGLLDQMEARIEVGYQNPISNKMQSICRALTALLQSRDPNVDFKAKAYEIIHS